MAFAISPLGASLAATVRGNTLDPQKWSNPDAQPPAQPPAMPAMSKGQLILGILADALAGAQGKPGAFAAQMGQQRQQQQEEVQWQRRRAEGIQDYGQKQAIDQQYAKPPAPYRWESNDGSLMEMGPDGQPRVAFKDPTPKISWIAADGPGGKVMIPVGPNGPLTGGGATGAPAPGTLEGGYRFKGGNAADPSAWEPATGGPTPPASGTFR